MSEAEASLSTPIRFLQRPEAALKSRG